jgi:hypothetical protein
MMRYAVVLATAIYLVMTLNGAFAAAATAFSTDGEATVYRSGDFRGDFTLEYRALLEPQPRNKTWSTLSVTLLGGSPPADAITIGLFPDAGVAHVFTSAVHNGAATFHDTRIICSRACTLGLHGDRGSIVAVVAGKLVNAWPRFSFGLPHPTVQLNAEVSGSDDRIRASLTPVKERAARVQLGMPLCGFTTQGVFPESDAGTLRFSGSFVRGAPANYIDLRNGRRLERCPLR